MRNYVRKTNRGLVSLELMQAAASEVLQGNKVRSVAKKLNICHSTLFRFVRKLKSGEKPTIGYKPKLLFTVQQEREIAKRLASYSKIFFGLGLDDARKLAYQYVVKNLNIPSGWQKNGTAGKEWIVKFIIRHPQIHVRSLKAKIDSKKSITTEYFNKMFGLFEEYKFLAPRIYRLVDISITPVLKYRDMSDGSVLASVDEGKPVNVQLAANALGEIIPPMFVLPIDAELKTNTQGFVSTGNGSGKMTSKEFVTYLKHFIFHTEPNLSDPVLLLLDSHQYVIDVDVLEKAGANSITLLSLPSFYKLGHPLQPLDELLQSFQDNCKSAQVEMVRSNGRKPVNVHDIPEIVGKVLPSDRDIKRSFRKAGLWPFNPSVVTGEEFVPSAVEENVCNELPRTPAERQKQYRERLKQRNPEKFLAQKRKNNERTEEKRMKISEYPYSEQERIRKEWREKKKESHEEQSTTLFEMNLVPQTHAERQKRYRERLKQRDPEKFLAQKRKNLERTKERRKKISDYPLSEQERIREEWRERKKKKKEQSSSRKQWRSKEQEGGEESLPGPSGVETTLPGTPQQSDLDTNDSIEEEPQDPLKKDETQCRCCGEITEDCIDVTIEEKPYLSSNRTTLALNGLYVDLDFNNNRPKTVCRVCDEKLHEIYNFINRVTAAQETMNNLVGDDEKDETLVLKTESDPSSDDDVFDNDDTDPIAADNSTVNEPVSVKSVFTHKRKSNRDKTKVKKAKVCEAREDSEFMVDIKEEIDNDVEEYTDYEVSDTGTSELKVRIILCSEMAGGDALS